MTIRRGWTIALSQNWRSGRRAYADRKILISACVRRLLRSVCVAMEAWFRTDSPIPCAFLRPAVDSDWTFIERLEKEIGRDAGRAWSRSEHRSVDSREDGVHLIVTIDEEAVGFVVLSGKSDPNGEIELRRLLVQHDLANVTQMAVVATMDLCFSDWFVNQIWIDPVNCDAGLLSTLRMVGFGTEPSHKADGNAVLSISAAVYTRRWDGYRVLRRMLEA